MGYCGDSDTRGAQPYVCMVKDRPGSACSQATIQRPACAPCRKPRRSQIANLPPDINQTVTNQLSASSPARHKITPLSCQTASIGITHVLTPHQYSPATKLPPCPVTKQTCYNLNILPSKHTTTVVIIYNLQAPTSIDNLSIRHTVTKQTCHPPPVQKQEPTWASVPCAGIIR